MLAAFFRARTQPTPTQAPWPGTGAGPGGGAIFGGGPAAPDADEEDPPSVKDPLGGGLLAFAGFGGGGGGPLASTAFAGPGGGEEEIALAFALAPAFCFTASSFHRAKTLPLLGGPPGFGTGAAGFTFAPAESALSAATFAAGEAFPDFANSIAAWTKPWA